HERCAKDCFPDIALLVATRTNHADARIPVGLMMWNWARHEIVEKSEGAERGQLRRQAIADARHQWNLRGYEQVIAAAEHFVAAQVQQPFDVRHPEPVLFGPTRLQAQSLRGSQHWFPYEIVVNDDQAATRTQKRAEALECNLNVV